MYPLEYLMLNGIYPLEYLMLNVIYPLEYLMRNPLIIDYSRLTCSQFYLNIIVQVYLHVTQEGF